MSMEPAALPSSGMVESGLGATHPPGPAAPQPNTTWLVRVVPTVGREAAVLFAACMPGSLGVGVMAVPAVDAVANFARRNAMPEMAVRPAPLPMTYTDCRATLRVPAFTKNASVSVAGVALVVRLAGVAGVTVYTMGIVIYLDLCRVWKSSLYRLSGPQPVHPVTTHARIFPVALRVPFARTPRQ